MRQADFSVRLSFQVAVVGLHLAQPNCALKQTIISVTRHPECSSFDPMLEELGVIAATAPVPLLTAQVRVVENEGESSNN